MSEPVAGSTGGGERYYCDSNAGAEPLPEVLAEFVAAERRCRANPASAHASGRLARGVLERARDRIAGAFGLAAADVVFTSGGTEACNLAVAGLGDPALPVLLSPAEHPAVAGPAERRGAHWWTVDRTGRTVVTRPDRPVGLLALVHAQSEVGTLQPVGDALRLAADLGVPVLIDAAQTLGRVPLRELLATDATVSLSPHKAGGLRGHGVLLGRDLATRLRPLLLGGGQELGLRPGTQSPSLASANALAIELATEQQPRRQRRMAAAREAFLAGVRSIDDDVGVLTPLSDSVPNTVMLGFSQIDGRSLLLALDLAGVEASHGSACSSGAPTPPRVLLAMGLDERHSRACVRFSFDWRDETDASRRAGELVGAISVRARRKI